MATIVVGVDGSDESKEALRWALEEARLRGATVRAVYAWRDPYVLAPGFGLPEDFEFDALRERAVETLDAGVADHAPPEQLRLRGVSRSPTMLTWNDRATPSTLEPSGEMPRRCSAPQAAQSCGLSPRRGGAGTGTATFPGR